MWFTLIKNCFLWVIIHNITPFLISKWVRCDIVASTLNAFLGVWNEKRCKTNENGGIIYEYGWAELIINKNNIKVICENDGEIKTILNFYISSEIPREYKYLELIQIYLKRGFNSIYAYNYSKIEIFNRNCENYFITLSTQIQNDKNK